MIEFYFEIRAVHIGSVILSGLIFFLRGVGLHAFKASWPMAAPVRFTSYTVDTVLLTSAMMLTVILQQYPLADHWLTVKVALLIIYIVLGAYGLKYAKTPRARLGFWLAALTLYLYIVSVARAHDPLGIFTLLF